MGVYLLTVHYVVCAARTERFPQPAEHILFGAHDSRTRSEIYAGTWLGVYESTDAGATWHRFGAGLPLAIINDLYMPSDGSFLRAASYGRGVWDYHF